MTGECRSLTYFTLLKDFSKPVRTRMYGVIKPNLTTILVYCSLIHATLKLLFKWDACGLLSKSILSVLDFPSRLIALISFMVCFQNHTHRIINRRAKVLFTDCYTWLNLHLWFLRLVNRLYLIIHKTQKSSMKVLSCVTVSE